MTKKENKETKTQSEEMVTFSEYAANIFYDNATQHWMFATVNFDPKTKEVGNVDFVDCGHSKDEAVQKFKVFVGRNFL